VVTAAWDRELRPTTATLQAWLLCCPLYISLSFPSPLGAKLRVEGKLKKAIKAAIRCEQTCTPLPTLTVTYSHTQCSHAQPYDTHPAYTLKPFWRESCVPRRLFCHRHGTLNTIPWETVSVEQAVSLANNPQAARAHAAKMRRSVLSLGGLCLFCLP
jgi:hypothetical protein